MTEVVLYHHIQGLTEGVRSFAEELRQAGHTVHTPDLFDGRTFGSIEEGMSYAQKLGFPGEILARGARAERAPVEQVGCVHGVPGAAQFVGERDDAGGQALRVMEENHFGHGGTLPGQGPR